MKKKMLTIMLCLFLLPIFGKVIYDASEVNNESQEKIDEVGSVDSTEAVSADDATSRYQPLVMYWQDKSDAPASYGEIAVDVATRAFSEATRPGDSTDIKFIDSPASLAHDTHQGLYLGYDAPDTDPDDISYASDSATLDDEYGALGPDKVGDPGYWAMEEYDSEIFSDDETAFRNVVSQPDGSILFNPYDDELNFEIPYMFSKFVTKYYDTLEEAQDACGSAAIDLSDSASIDEGAKCEGLVNPITQANLVIWMDTDLSGTFDASEGMIIEDIDQYRYTGGYDFALYEYHYLDVSYDISGLSAAQRSKLASEGTYLRLVLTSDTDYGVEDGGVSPAAGTYGEIEDYKLSPISSSTCGSLPSLETEMIPASVDDSKVDEGILVYENIPNPYSTTNMDIRITTFGGRSTVAPGSSFTGTEILSYSSAGENIFFYIATGIDNRYDPPIDGSYTIEFLETGTENPMNIDFSIRVGDYDDQETQSFNVMADNYTSEFDNQFIYNEATGEVHYTTTPQPTYELGFNGDVGTTGSVTYTFENVNTISTTMSENVPWTEDVGFHNELFFPLTAVEHECPDFEVDKTSTPIGDGSVDVAQGETITYQVDAKSTIASDIGLKITEPLDADLGYVADSAKLTLNGVDVTGDATISYSADKNQLQVIYDHDVASDDQFMLTFDAIVLDQVAPYTIENTAIVSDIHSMLEFITPTTTHNVVANTDVTIDKTLVESNANGYVDVGEDLAYTISVTNPSSTLPASGILVRDSLIESLPSYLSYDDTVVVEAVDTSYTGSLTTGDFTLKTVAPDEVATITYVVHVDSLPDGIDEITNIATDGGLDPLTDCDATTVDHCSEVIIPTNGKTDITKSVDGLGANGLVDRGETLEYTLKVNNPGTKDAVGVAVRDSMLENLADYPWITFNDDVKVQPRGVSYTGSLTDGNFVIDEIAAGEEVTITYSITITDTIPSSIGKLENIATDDGSEPVIDPTCDPTTSDCGAIVDPDVNPETLIEKVVAESTPNGVVDLDEDLVYTINVTNLNSYVSSYDVAVRDSMLENLPTNVSFDGSINVEGSTYTGDLTEGTFTLDEVKPDSTVTITYAIHVDSLPSDISSLTNIATDGGLDPITECDETTADSCSEVTLPVNGSTIITKSVDGLGENGLVDRGETLTYTIKVSNPGTKDATLVLVRDSMLENLADLPWITFNNDVKLQPETIVSTGSLTSGNFVIDKIAGGEEVTITYSITITDSIPVSINKLENVATDNGSDPVVDPDCDPTTSDCGAIVDPDVNPDTLIEKLVVESTPNDVVDLDEDLIYTINVMNPNKKVSSYNVAVRDSMLENLPTNVSFDGSINVEGSTYTGDLTEGTFTLDEVTPDSTVTITYTIHVNSLPSDFSELRNIATDNGINPNIVCDNGDDCSEVTLPIKESDSAIAMTGSEQPIIILLAAILLLLFRIRLTYFSK